MNDSPYAHSAYKSPNSTRLGDAPARRRRSIRLPDYDYSQPGAYFITVCTRKRACIFGSIVAGRMNLSKVGRLAQAVWLELPQHYHHVQLDTWTIMPNHVHGIVILDSRPVHQVGAGLKPAPTQRHGLPEIVRAFKTFSARRINALQGTAGTSLWQRNYYEHVIRDEGALDRIRQYIVDNPARWHEDPENPNAVRHR